MSAATLLPDIIAAMRATGSRRARTIALWALMLLAAGFSPAILRAESGPSGNGPRFVAYYFHTTARCATCVKIEELAEQVVRKDFAEQIRSGRLQFLSIDVQFPQNQHYVKDFQLVTKSVVLVEQQDGLPLRWKNLSRVWELVWSQARYEDYIRTEVSAFLGGR